MKTGFVYLWRDKKRKMFYLGSHCGQENDRYICGSKRMLAAYRKRKNDFKRRVIFRAMISNHRELKKIEQRFLDLIKPIEFGARYYNFSSRAFGADPVKASEWMKGNKNNLGKKLSENARKKISDFHKGRPQPEWLKIKSGLAKRGRKWHTNGSEESLCKICPDGWVRGRSAAYIKIVRERIYDASHGEKISAAKLASGYTHSMETRKKISTTKRARFEAANIT